jgi:malonyl-CoA/methylmalonyl-CoA synthetase
VSNGNFYTALARSALNHAQRVALEIPDGRNWTYRELDQVVGKYAVALVEQGLAVGDRLAVQVDKSPESLFLYLACLRAGLVYLPLNTAYPPAELAYFLSDAEPSAVVCRPQSEGEVRALLAAQRSETNVLSLDGAGGGSLPRAVDGTTKQCPVRQLDASQLAVIIYTSGTTGRSKGAMLSHRNLQSNAEVLVDYWGFTANDILLHALPIFHVHGLFVANHCALLSGAKLRWHGKFEAAAVVHDLDRATVMMGVPTFYSRLLAEPGFDAAVCAHMRLFISGSAPLQLDTFEAFRVRTGHTIMERYGMSEAGMITSNPLRGERHGGTVGFPLPGVSVRITDAQDQPLQTGSTGSIQVRGDNVFAGYWRNPEKTRDEFTADTWFRTGDVGAFDAGGYLTIVGRAKDLIITGGYNVYPKEIELAIDAIPGVAESAVVGVPHADFGEAVVAVVVCTSEPAPLTEMGIISELKLRLANYKVPKRVHFVQELPRNAMGKIQKAHLRDRFAAL